MPKNWLDSKPAPDPPVLDWLKWTSHDLERHTTSGTVAAFIGLNKMGDLQTIFSPIVIQNAFNNGGHSAITLATAATRVTSQRSFTRTQVILVQSWLS